MANINLISARRAERIRLTRIAKGMVLASVGAGVLGFGTVALMFGQLFVAQARLAALQQELGKLRPIIQEIESAKRERDALRPKLETLAEAQKTTARWHGLMEGLKRAMPEQTWLTNISAEKALETRQTMKINGVTVNQTRVGEAIYRLSQQPDYYKRIDLRYTNSTKINKRESVEFELAAELNRPELEAAVEEDDASKTK